MRPTLDFLLYDWLAIDALRARPRFADHSRETFDAVLDMCEKLAAEKFAPFARLSDTEEPWFDGEKVHLPAASVAAARAYAESGMLAAAQDYEIGGMQLPCVVEMAANAFFAQAGIGVGGGAMLTSGNANLLMAHGTKLQQTVFAHNEFNGRFAGTMCLSEPQAGSSLSDIATRAVPDGAGFAADPLGPRYRLRGNKMWISNGEHELTENIIHLVLAKIPEPDGRLVAGTRGISLFIVPKMLVYANGELTGERNDVALAGLNHKLGYRGIPNTLLNFGEGRFPVRAGDGRGVDGQGSGAIGYLVGKPGKVLLRLFQTSRRFNVEIQPQLVLLQKTLLNIEGLGRQLDPDLDLWKSAKPYLERWMAEQMGWRGLMRQVSEEAPDWARMIPQLPRLLHRALSAHADGSLAEQVQVLAARQRRQNRLLAVLLALVGALLLVELVSVLF